jgi:hypothetical protein
VQNEPNLPNSKNQRNHLFTNNLRKYLPFRPPQNKPKTNPNEPKANPIFRPSGPPEAKTNPNKPKTKPIELEAKRRSLRVSFLKSSSRGPNERNSSLDKKKWVGRIKFPSKILIMNHVERFRAVMNFKPVDRLPRWEWAMWWDQTIERWHHEGLPSDLKFNDVFGISQLIRREGTKQ